MPTWGELLKELASLQQRLAEIPTAPDQPTPYDILRRTYLDRLAATTGRAVIAYYTAWLEPRSVDAAAVSIQLGDIQGFMEAVSNVREREVDLFLHSPGGSPEAAASIVEYLRSRFDHIRVIVPIAAMSAATMVALAADEIVMGAHSQLGPIDPQLTIATPEGPRSSPAQAILDQFELAKRECQNPANIGAWLPILRSYLPGLIAQCKHARELSESLVAQWLQGRMFRDTADEAEREKLAKAAAAWFADFTHFKSHAVRVGRDEARQQKVKVTNLEADHELQDLMLSVHHAFQHTLASTGVTKIIENHHGRAWIQISQTAIQVLPPSPPPLSPSPATKTEWLTRQQRRQREKQQRKPPRPDHRV